MTNLIVLTSHTPDTLQSRESMECPYKRIYVDLSIKRDVVLYSIAMFGYKVTPPIKLLMVQSWLGGKTMIFGPF